MTSKAMLQEKERHEQTEAANDIGFARRLREIYAQTTLRPGEDLKLFSQMQEGGLQAERAKQRLIEGVQKYVVSEAKKRTGRGVELEDLIQEGLSGVLRAMETYDPESGNTFLTYADYWIRQRMMRACERDGSIERYGSRIPGHQYNANGRAMKVIDAMREELGREPTPEELMKRARLQTPQAAASALELLSRSFTSLDAHRGNDESDTSLVDAIADEQAVDPGRDLMVQERNEKVWDVFGQLSEDEQKVLRLRYGLHTGRKPMKQDEVCEEMGIKKSRLVSLQRSALKQLQASPELRGMVDEILNDND